MFTRNFFEHGGERNDPHIGTRLRPILQSRVELLQCRHLWHLRAAEHFPNCARHVGKIAHDHWRRELLEFFESQFKLGQSIRFAGDPLSAGSVVAVGKPKQKVERDHAIRMKLLRAFRGACASGQWIHEEERARKIAGEQIKLRTREQHHVLQTKSACVRTIFALLSEHATKSRGRARSDEGHAHGSCDGDRGWRRHRDCRLIASSRKTRETDAGDRCKCESESVACEHRHTIEAVHHRAINNTVHSSECRSCTKRRVSSTSQRVRRLRHMQSAVAIVEPRSAGLSLTVMPQARSASIFACAVSSAPPMIAPA